MSQPPGPQGPYQPYPGPGQPPGFGPGGYPQQAQGWSPYGPQGGPPKKSPLPWILGGVGALLVIGGAVTAVILLTGGDDEDGNGPGGPGGPGGTGGAANASTAEGAAQGIVTAINNQDSDGIVALTCEPMKPQMKMMALALADPSSIPGLPADLHGKLTSVKVSAALDRVENESDTSAKAYITMKMDGLPPEAAQYDMKPESTIDFPFMLSNGKWELCDPTASGQPMPGGQPPTFSQGAPPTGPG